MRVKSATLLLPLASLVSACDILPGGTCTLEARAGITVEVRDSVTGAPAATGAIAIARDGAFADTLMSFDGVGMSGAWERPGTYAVNITKFGYEAWSETGVLVADGGCHVRGVVLEARLQPL